MGKVVKTTVQIISSEGFRKDVMSSAEMLKAQDNEISLERTCLVLSLAYHTSSDSIMSILENADIGQFKDVRAAKRRRMLDEFNEMLALKSYNIDTIAAVIGVKFKMKASSVYLAWSNDKKKAFTRNGKSITL